MNQENNIRVVTTTGEEGPKAVAELALALAQLLLRPIHRALRETSNGILDNTPFVEDRRIQGTTWVILGAGRQARHMARLASAFEAGQVVVYHPQMDAARRARFTNSANLRTTVDLDYALSVGDIISIHLPLVFQEEAADRPPTYRLLDQERLAHMKAGAILINVSRDDIVDETAILGGLKSRRLYGYATDVLTEAAQVSRNPADSVLWSAYMDHSPLNLLITPHIGGSTRNASQQDADQIVTAVLGHLDVDDSQPT